MKTRLFNLFAASFAALCLAAGCQEKPEDVKPEEDNYITATPNKVEASWEEGIYDVNVESNCSWTVSKTDSEGNAIDWVQCDIKNGKDNTSFQLLVLENTSVERSATVTLACGDVKAFIDVVQAANPTPVIPDPEPVIYEYYFDFTTGMLDWPTSKDISWGTLKSFDSGLALDLGTEADNPENLRRRGTVTYTLNETAFDFILADPNAATAHNIYLDPAKGVYLGTYRYLGLPALEGKKIVKAEITQNASTIENATNPRDVGICVRVYNVDNTKDKNIKYVEGGDPQAQDTNLATYTYELSETAVNTVYWIVSPNRASIIHSVRLFYADADGNEPAPEPDVEPEPEQPETPVEPETPTEPETPVGPEPENTLKLTFDFTGAPMEGWPTAKLNDKGELACVYDLNGTNYTFILTACKGASAIGCHWTAPADPNAGYFNFYAEKRYLGLPAIEGYYLYRVVCNNAKMSATVPQIGVTSLVADGTAHPADTDYVTGGNLQEWDANGGGTYTYTLGGTAADTVYYLYAFKKGAIATLELTYAPVSK